VSETQGGDDWWLASDGKWYPPPATNPAAPAEGTKPWWKRKRVAVAGGTDAEQPAGQAATEQSDADVATTARSGSTETPATTAASPDDSSTTAEPTTTAEPETTTTTTTTTTTAPFQPIERSGVGNDVITFDEPVDVALIARMSHTGSSNFQVTLFGDDGERTGSIANVIGDWSGEVPVNFRDGERFSFMEITADGTWAISFDSVLSATIAGTESGDTYAGSGSQVLLCSTDGPTVIDVDCPTCGSNVQITAFGDRRNGVANEIGDNGYAASHLVPAGTVILHVNMAPNSNRATPDWTITVQ